MNTKVTDIIVFGIGAVGSNVVLNIIRDLPEVNITIVDFDKVEARNYLVGTQPYLKSHLNRAKTQALQLICLQYDKKINAINKKIETKNDILEIFGTIYNGNNSIMVIDAFDTAKYRNLLHNINLPYIDILHIGFNDMMSGESAWDDIWTPVNKENPTNLDICTLQGARSFIMSLTAMASLIINDYYFNGIKKNFYFDKGLNIKKY